MLQCRSPSGAESVAVKKKQAHPRPGDMYTWTDPIDRKAGFTGDVHLCVVVSRESKRWSTVTAVMWLTDPFEYEKFVGFDSDEGFKLLSPGAPR